MMMVEFVQDALNLNLGKIIQQAQELERGVQGVFLVGMNYKDKIGKREKVIQKSMKRLKKDFLSDFTGICKVG